MPFEARLMYSQSESYKPGSAAPELTYRPLKKLAYLFGEPLVSWGFEEIRRQLKNSALDEDAQALLDSFFPPIWNVATRQSFS
jgi:hypothetical protein